MISIEEVKLFLDRFHQKMKVYSIFFLDGREKNMQTLFELEITPAYRESVICNLMPTDYSEGPLPDNLFHGSDLWVFGKTVKGKEVYIEICMGRENSQTICISFHLAEYPMKYPLKGGLKK